MVSIDKDSTAYEISQFTFNLLLDFKVPEAVAKHLNVFVLLLILSVLVYLLQLIVRGIIRGVLRRAQERTGYSFFGYLLNKRFAHFFALIAPFSLVKNSIPIVFIGFPKWISILDKFADAYMVLMIIWMIMALISSAAELLKENPAYRQKPLESYLQVLRMIMFLFGAIIMFSIFTGKSPVAFFTAMGAMSAVLLLMFKDTIMGFVASIQVTTNDMVQIGDRITMSKFGADGNVTEINLTTVKVQNFDKTITTIPTYALTSESFQNWRGVEKAGVTRIKRPIYIKQSSIRFVEDTELEKFNQIQGISNYIKEKSEEILEHNKRIGADRNVRINSRNLTNLGLFRQYVEWYLRNHPKVRQDMTLMVRQLPVSSIGLPLELYVFTNTTKANEFENIVSDIFDHLFSSVKYFDLEIYEVASN